MWKRIMGGNRLRENMRLCCKKFISNNYPYAAVFIIGLLLLSISYSTQADILWIGDSDWQFTSNRVHFIPESSKSLEYISEKILYGNYKVIVFSDFENRNFSENSQLIIEKYVENGGAIVFVGGINSYGQGGWRNTILSNISPVDIVDDSDAIFEDFNAHEVSSPSPILHGYNFVKPKNGALVELINPIDRSPLLVFGKLGTGRTVAFTSDAGGLWGKDFKNTDYSKKMWDMVFKYATRSAFSFSLFIQNIIMLVGTILVLIPLAILIWRLTKKEEYLLFLLLFVSLLLVRTIIFNSYILPSFLGYPIESDGVGYFAILENIVQDHNLNLVNQMHLNYLTSYAVVFSNNTEKWVSVFQFGVTLFWLPFFLLFGTYGIIISGIFYTSAGLSICYNTTKKLFSKSASLMSCILFLFALPLFYYTVIYPSFAHAVGFFTMALVVWIFSLENMNANGRISFLLGMSIAISATVRYINGLILIPIMGYYFVSLKSNIRVLVALLLGFFFISLSIPIYWKMQYGSYFLSGQAMAGEKMLSLPEHFFHILFSPIRGLFIWHPIVLIAIIGTMLYLKTINKKLAIISLIYFILWTYAYGSFPHWTAGATAGQRFGVDMIPLFIPGLAAFLDFKKKSGIVSSCLLTLYSGIILASYALHPLGASVQEENYTPLDVIMRGMNLDINNAGMILVIPIFTLILYLLIIEYSDKTIKK